MGNKMRLQCTKAHAWEDDNIMICTYVIRFYSFFFDEGPRTFLRGLWVKIRVEIVVLGKMYNSLAELLVKSLLSL